MGQNKMIKLLDILREGTISLTSDEKKQIDKAIPEIIDAIKNPSTSPASYITYKLADGSPGMVTIYVLDDDRSSGGYFQANDPNNLKDNDIVIQSYSLSPYFKDWDEGRPSTQTTDLAKEGIGIIKRVLTHELIHAKDPALNNRYMKEPYDSSKEEIYYKSWTEFQTMTGQFFEAINDSVDRIMNNNPTSSEIELINRSLSDLLDFFSGKEKNISNETKEFITYTPQTKNIFQKISSFIDKILLIPSLTGKLFDTYINYLNKIKKYNPEGYKEFLKDLYKNIDAIKDKINKVNENDPKKGTGKKPEGSGRRLYTDENPKDTVRVKFKTAQDIKDTLSKKTFKSKPHARQSQVINLIHQRVRAAYNKAKDPEVKSRLKRALDYIEKRKEASKLKTQRLNKVKETADPQSGKSSPYGSGYAPAKK
jgi:DNA-directed RNA polymerase subunit F